MNDFEEGDPMGKKRKSCPYLDTINRTLLDFDFERSCCVTLQSGPHVYGCLVCGKFFRGRGRHTPAFTHSVDENHCVFVHLSTGKFYCLPDDYEIVDNPSLSDISAALNPTFTAEEVAKLDTQTALARDLFGKRYLRGFVGLNNLKKTDYVNATVQALAHVRPLRDYFLLLGAGNDNSTDTTPKSDGKKKLRKTKKPVEYSHLALCFGALMRKMWSDKRFKSNVDPHEMIQAVSVASKKRYHIGRQAEAGEFMAWLLHQLHLGVGGTKKPGSSVIHDIFQGSVEVTTRQRKQRVVEVEEEDDREGSDDEEERREKEEARKRKREEMEKVVIEENSATTNFLQLTLDIPEKPLFKDDEGGLVIPQEPLVSVLRKFDGVSFSDAVSRQGTPQKRRYRLKKLPDYLILHLARFKRNSFYTEKNPTIVAFPVKNLDLSQYVFPDSKPKVLPKEEDVRSMNVKELKQLLTENGLEDVAKKSIEKTELMDSCIDLVTRSLPHFLEDKYDLVANICHDSPAEVGREGQRDPLEEGSYRCHVQHKASGQWYEMQDLHVQETMPQLIGLSESYLLIFERKGVNSESSSANGSHVET